MYSPEVTIIAIPPQDFWGATFILGLLLATGLIYLAVSQPGKPYRAPAWESLSPLALAIIIPLAILWVALFLLAVWAAFWATYQLLQPHAATSSPQTSGLGALGLGTLLAGLLGAPFVIWGTVLKHRTVGFQKEGHLTDRISKAVEQLGAEKTVKRHGSEETVPNIEVRIGGILSLERIAQDSTAYDYGRDHVRCMEMLCAYIRENAPASLAPEHPNPADGLDKSLDEIRESARKVLLWANELPSPRVDIAMAIKVIGKRSSAQLAIEKRAGFELNLSRTCLQRADLAGFEFANANFGQSRLEGAFAKNTNFRGANLRRVRLSRASCVNANFDFAKLEQTDFTYAICDGASFSECQFSYTAFIGSQLKGADFKFLGNPSPRTVAVNRAYFIDPYLESAKLSGGTRESILFAFMRSPSHQGSATKYLALRDMAAPKPFCEDAALAKCFGDASVTLPETLSWPKHWPAFALSDGAFDTEWRKWQASPDTYTPPDPPK